MTLKTSLLTTVAAMVFVTFPASAERMSLAMSLDVIIHASRSTFEPNKDHSGEDWLYLTKSDEDIQFDVRLSMTGQKSVHQKGRTQVNEVPGVSEGVSGFKRARIETFGNEVTLVIETKLTRKKQKDGKEVEEKEESVQRIPLQFKDKSAGVQDLKNGTMVEFRISSAGLKAILDGAGAKQKGAMNLKAEGQGASVSASGSAKLLDSHQKGAVFISADQIQYEAPPMRIRASAKTRVKT